MPVVRAAVQVVVLQGVVGQHVQLPGVDIRHVGLDRHRAGTGVKQTGVKQTGVKQTGVKQTDYYT